jgi:uncharacterized protein YccT (UPF0319 family)
VFKGVVVFNKHHLNRDNILPNYKNLSCQYSFIMMKISLIKLKGKEKLKLSIKRKILKIE